jgi:acyl-CoA reductase-like NAD-dependent aldehyde dehydrogenase
MCTSTQRLYVHRDVEREFCERLVAVAAGLRVGDPRDPSTDVGPMICEKEAVRAESWVREAVAAGATLLHGGRREGSLLFPTILGNVTAGMRVAAQEIFAPVIAVMPYGSLDEAIAEINASPFGLAVGIFSRDVTRVMNAARRLQVGVVHVNESSSSRVDLLPFAGVKQSGLGREGPKYAMQEMTQERLVTFNLA